MIDFANPNYKPYRDLGAGSLPDQAAWDALKTKVTDFLDANPDKSTLYEADARYVDLALSDDRVWAQVASELGLSLVGKPSLLNFYKGTFANASPRFIWHDGVLYGPFAGGNPAIIVIDGRRFYQSEAARTNRILGDMSGQWTTAGVAGIATGATDPLGGTDAFAITGLGASGADDIREGGSGFTASAAIANSIFVNRVSTTDDLGVANTQSANNGDWDADLATMAASYERLTSTHEDVTVVNAFAATAGGAAGMRLFRGSGSGAKAVDAIWPQQEEAAFPSSLIPTVGSIVARAADSMSFAAGAYPAALLSGRYTIRVIPFFSSADLANSEAHYILTTTAARRLTLDKTSGGTARCTFATSGDDAIRNCSWSRLSVLTITTDFVTGELTLAGFDSGNGTTTAASPTDWAGGGTLYAGMNSSSAQHFDGLIGEPELG